MAVTIITVYFYNCSSSYCFLFVINHYTASIAHAASLVAVLVSSPHNDAPLSTMHPYNIASYGMLLTLIAKEVNMKPRKLIGFLADVHIYEDQMDGVETQLKRTTHKLPTLEIE